MSISEIPKNTEKFSKGKNIRIAIGGLSICDFAIQTSEIRFLRHVEKHKLKMKIIKKQADDFSFVDSIEYEIGEKLKNIKITGATAPQTPTFEHIPTTYQEYPLSKLISFSLLHGHELDFRSPLPYKPGSTTERIESPTLLKIENCSFYTAKLTDHKYNFKKENIEIRFDDYFGEILGGYMTVVQELRIQIPGALQGEINLPIEENGIRYVYEIELNNSCFEESGTPCNEVQSDRTDFLDFYDVLEDKINPMETFDLVQLKNGTKAATGTGACLPACRTC